MPLGDDMPDIPEGWIQPPHNPWCSIVIGPDLTCTCKTPPPVKLVRDRIGSVRWRDEECKQRLGRAEPGGEEHRRLLGEKLREEADELIEAFGARDYAAVVEEAADVYETLLALIALSGRPFDSPHEARLRLVGAADRKRTERGGFVEGVTYDGPPYRPQRRWR